MSALLSRRARAHDVLLDGVRFFLLLTLRLYPSCFRLLQRWSDDSSSARNSNSQLLLRFRHGMFPAAWSFSCMWLCGMQMNAILWTWTLSAPMVKISVSWRLMSILKFRVSVNQDWRTNDLVAGWWTNETYARREHRPYQHWQPRWQSML